MNISKNIICLLILTVLLCSSCKQEQNRTQLFNGENLDNWDMYLGSSLGPEFDSLAATASPTRVFSVVTINGEKLIRISGEVNGSLATKEAFENYHLRIVFRWGDVVYSRRNSGLLYHSFGEFGQAFGTWIPNIEHQLMHDNLGDTYLMVNTCCETSATKAKDSNNFVFDPKASVLKFGEQANGRSIKKAANNEKPLGEWNTVDLYCFGATAVHVVNGVTVMVNKNTGIYVNGETKPLTNGKIQIQSEGAELFVKTIDIEHIDQLPKEIISQ